MEQVGDYSMQGVERGWMKRAAAGNTMITGGPALRTSPSLVTPVAAPGGGMTVQNLTVQVNGSFDFASPAERRAVAKALVKDINDELRVYQRQRG
jgi:hypothetical protein